MSVLPVQNDKEALVALKHAIQVLSLSANAQDLCKRIAHAEFMDGFCQGVSVYLLDQKSDLVEVASYGRKTEFAGGELSAWGNSVLAKSIRGRKIEVEELSDSTLFALPIELAGMTTGAFLFKLSATLPRPIFSREVTSMLSNLGGLFMQNQELILRSNKRANQSSQPAREDDMNVEELTTRQIQVIELMADGLTNAEIAKIVLLSESTVRQETIRIFRILKCHSRSEAIVKARATGVIGKVGQLNEFGS